MEETKLPPHVVWEYEGAFSIVIDEKEEMYWVLKAFLKHHGFTFRDNVASCSKVKIQGIKDCPFYADGILVAGQSFSSYRSIEKIIAVDDKVLWTR